MAGKNLAASLSSDRWKHTLLLVLIVGLAFGLRLFHLGHQELRGDEAFDALFAAQPVPVILGQLQLEQPYPPLFHVGLHFWLGLVGQSEAMQRLPALISGVLLVPLVYQVARLTLGEVTGLIAAALVAVNPFYTWHSQDGRMYSLLAMLSVASLWLALRLLQGRASIRVAVAYWAVTVLALLTHYFAWSVLLSENAAAVLILWKHNPAEAGTRQRRSRWLIWQVAVCLALLPWLIFASRLLTSHASSWIQAIPVLEMLRRSATTYSMGQTLPPTAALAFALGMGVLFLLGCFFPSRPVGPGFRVSGRGLLLLFLGVPLLATLLLSLARPAFDEKYLIALAAIYLILVAHGLHFLAGKGKLVAVAAGVALLVGTGWSVSNYYFNPLYAKSPSWRSLVQEIQANAQDGDVIVQNYPDPGLAYYYHGDLAIRLLPASVTSPQERTSQTLEKLAAAHRRIWFIPGPNQAWDRAGVVEQWLRRFADLVDDRTTGSQHLQLYQTAQAFLESMSAVDINLGDQIRLLGYRLAPATSRPPGDGGRLVLTLYWQVLAPVDVNYSVFVHLADSNEQIWGQHDGQPVGGTYPTSQWQAGQIIVDPHAIEIDPQLPPGAYRLMTGLYDSSDGQRLTVADVSDGVDRDRIVLTSLEFSGSAD